MRPVRPRQNRHLKVCKLEIRHRIVFIGQEHPESNDLSNFKPSRRVRTAPGGATHDIFGHNEGEDALSSAPHQFHGSVPKVRIALFINSVGVITEPDFGCPRQ